MPFKSEAQRRFMWAQHPEMAREWQAKTPKGKLPERVGKKKEAGFFSNLFKPSSTDLYVQKNNAFSDYINPKIGKGMAPPAYLKHYDTWTKKYDKEQGTGHIPLFSEKDRQSMIKTWEQAQSKEKKAFFNELEKMGAEFIDPFKVMDAARPMNIRELTRAARQAITAELEAVHLYEAVADAADHNDAKKLFQEVADEEKVHAGEFEALLRKLDPDQERLHTEGLDEAQGVFGKDKQASDVMLAAFFDELEKIGAVEKDAIFGTLGRGAGKMFSGLRSGIGKGLMRAGQAMIPKAPLSQKLVSTPLGSRSFAMTAEHGALPASSWQRIMRGPTQAGPTQTAGMASGLQSRPLQQSAEMQAAKQRQLQNLKAKGIKGLDEMEQELAIPATGTTSADIRLTESMKPALNPQAETPVFAPAPKPFRRASGAPRGMASRQTVVTAPPAAGASSLFGNVPTLPAGQPGSAVAAARANRPTFVGPRPSAVAMPA